MRRMLTAFSALLCCVLLAGCAPQDSLFPLFLESDAVFDPQILGTWTVQAGSGLKGDEDKRQALFAKGERERTYEVTIPNLDQGTAFISHARLVKLGNYLFIDLGSPDLEHSKANFIGYPAVTSHVFGRVFLNGDSMRIAFLSDQWIKDHAKEGNLTLPSITGPDGILLTAKTEELREFAIEHAEDTEVFSERFLFERKK